MEAQGTFAILFLILVLGMIIPEIFKKFHVPFISGIILVGGLLGPNGFSLIEPDNTIEFFSFLGMVFLMLMAGLDTNLDHLKKLRQKIFIMAGFNGLIPFFTGFVLAQVFGYSLHISILIGVIFISSSVAIIITLLKSSNMFKTRLGEITSSSVLILDALSLMALTILLRDGNAIEGVPFYLYFVLLIASIAGIFVFLPKITNKIMRHYLKSGSYVTEVRISLVVIMGVLLYFSFLDVHPVLSAFIVGVTLSHIIKSEKLYGKIKTIGNSFFVPVFFFVIGMELDFAVFTRLGEGVVVILSFVIALIFSKMFSGYIGGRFIQMSKKESALYGTSSTIQLTTTLAVTYAAMSMELLDRTILTAIIMVTVVTTISGPLMFRWVQNHIPASDKKRPKKEDKTKETSNGSKKAKKPKRKIQ